MDELPLFDVDMQADDPTCARPPFQAGSHTSYLGAVHAQPRVGAQCDELIAMYRLHGNLTDQEMEDRTQIDRSSVIPRRRALVKIGRVQWTGGYRKNARTGINNKTYELTR